MTPACTAHNFNFADGTRKVVASWYTGGTSVIDFSDPSAPREIAYFRPEDADTWSSYYYRGQVFASDMNRGLDVLEIDVLPPRPKPPPPPPDEPDKPDPDKPKPDPKPCWVWEDAELEFLEKANAERERRGLDTVKIDPELTRVAQAHTDDMVSRRWLHHSDEEELRSRVRNWRILGENVGAGKNVDSLHKEFMNSQEHRDVILLPDFRFVGIGVSEGRNRMWVTVLFEAYKDPGTTLKMPKRC